MPDVQASQKLPNRLRLLRVNFVAKLSGITVCSVMVWQRLKSYFGWSGVEESHFENGRLLNPYSGRSLISSCLNGLKIVLQQNRSKPAGRGALITTAHHSEPASHGTKCDTGRSSPVSCRTATGPCHHQLQRRGPIADHDQSPVAPQQRHEILFVKSKVDSPRPTNDRHNHGKKPNYFFHFAAPIGLLLTVGRCSPKQKVCSAQYSP